MLYNDIDHSNIDKQHKLHYPSIYLSIYLSQYKYRNFYLKKYKASFIKNYLFIIFNCNFSSLLVIFLLLGSRWLRNCLISSAQALSTIFGFQIYFGVGIPYIFMLGLRISASVDVICRSIRCYRNILVIFSICAAGSYILKSVYLGSKSLFRQFLLKTMEHCLFTIFNCNFSILFVIFLGLGSWW